MYVMYTYVYKIGNGAFVNPIQFYNTLRHIYRKSDTKRKREENRIKKYMKRISPTIYVYDQRVNCGK